MLTELADMESGLISRQWEILPQPGPWKAAETEGSGLIEEVRRHFSAEILFRFTYHYRNIVFIIYFSFILFLNILFTY